MLPIKKAQPKIGLSTFLKKSVSEGNAVEKVAMLRQLERFYHEARLKIIKEFDNDIAGIHFGVIARLSDTALIEYVGESDSRRHSVKFDLLNAK